MNHIRIIDIHFLTALSIILLEKLAVWGRNVRLLWNRKVINSIQKTSHWPLPLARRIQKNTHTHKHSLSLSLFVCLSHSYTFSSGIFNITLRFASTSFKCYLCFMFLDSVASFLIGLEAECLTGQHI